jgi:hypothetical protein
MGDKDKKAVEKFQKVLEKYGNDPQKVAEAYAELEEKMGAQGMELGDLRKKSESLDATLQQYAEWVKGAQPIVEWYTKNQEGLKQWAAAQMNPQPQHPVPQPSHANSLLTPEEQQQLALLAAQQVQQSVLVPWSQTFAKTVEDWAVKRSKELDDRFEQKQRAYAQVWWKTLEHAIPKEKVESLRSLHEEAMKYADLQKLNPLKLAEEAITTRAKLADFEAQVKEYKDKIEAQEKASVASLGNGQGLFPRTDEEKAAIPKTRDDRFAKVMGSLGADGREVLFGKKS